MAESKRPKGSLDHLKKIDPNQRQDTGVLFTLDYHSYKDPYPRRDDSVAWPAVVSAFLYLTVIVGLVYFFLNRPGHFVETSTSGGLWIVCTITCLCISIVIDKKMSWPWLCTKGVIFAFLLTTGLCGLIASLCGNPFRPFM